MRIAITGSGVLCAGRSGREAVWERLLAAGAGERAAAAPLDLSVFPGAKGQQYWTRTAQLLAGAARQALDEAGWERLGAELPAEERGVVVGSTHGNVQASTDFDREALSAGPRYVSPQDFANTVINQSAGRLAVRYGLSGPNTTIATGGASALDALDYAATLLRRRRARGVLCGSALGWSPDLVTYYAAAGRVTAAPDGTPPFASGRRGAPLSEAAAAFTLEPEDPARARGAAVRALLSGCGHAFLPGEDGLLCAMRAALEQAGRSAAEVSCVVAHAAGHPRDAEEAAALRRLSLRAPVTAPKAVTGECLEASGAVGVAVALQCLAARAVPPIAGLERADASCEGLDLVLARPRAVDVRHVLVNACDPEGHCASVLLSAA